MGLKVYLVYEGEPKGDVPIQGDRLGREELKLTITLPDKWGPENCQKVLDFFVTNYNKKFPEKGLDPSNMRLKIGGIYLKLDGKISDQIREYADIFVLHNEPSVAVSGPPPGSLTCTNFGCGKYFFENENMETSCQHHSGAPIFHDTVKFWSCCEGHKAYDFDDFQKIPPCSVGKHSGKEKQLFARPIDQTVANVPLTQEQVAASQPATMVDAGGKRHCGPREFEGAVSAQQQPPQQIIDGKANCRNFGCGNKFVVDENHDTACTYHKGAPVFWDTKKYWSCCPDQKHYEFEDFAAVPGCVTGPHKL
eukprot:PhF_6_TR41569/c0_g1_i1/m.62980